MTFRTSNCVRTAPGNGFSLPVWETDSERVTDVSVSGMAVRAEIDATKLYGKTAVIGVRLHGPKGREAGWSNLVALDVVPALGNPHKSRGERCSRRHQTRLARCRLPNSESFEDSRAKPNGRRQARAISQPISTLPSRTAN